MRARGSRFMPTSWQLAACRPAPPTTTPHAAAHFSSALWSVNERGCGEWSEIAAKCERVAARRAKGAAMAEGGELVFRIMRLCHPSLELSTGLRVDLDRDMGAGLWESSVAEGSGAGSDPAPETMSVALDFSERVDLGASAGGLTGQLSFPQSFGTVCLGQTFSAAVTLCNQGDLPVTAVGIKVELQTERSKITLHDTTGSPVQSLPPGGRAELGVSLDVREVGPHTLTCSALFTDSGGGRQFKPQHFRFAALNPLLVRTKHRLVEDGPLLLELTLENATRAPLLLAGLRFLPEPGCSAVQLGEDASLDDGCVDGGAMESPRGPLASYIERLPVLEPAGGTWGAIFAMEHPRRLAGQAGGEMPLGRIDIRWRATLGEVRGLEKAWGLCACTSAKNGGVRVWGTNLTLPRFFPFSSRLVYRPSP